ncbi:hypothetical protein KST74_08705 [Fusobacterium nucleatum]|uniref:hypothetical protein n=1 Tax=Fusobacterium nucleatum TaxID=851 RepID=UPI0030CCF7F9
MEKEKVLEIETQEVFDKVAVRIKYQNFEVLKRGEFEDIEIGVVSFNNPCYLSYPYNQLHLKGKFKIDDDFIFTVTKEEFENIKNMVEAINEKYGIPKRWRAKRGEKHFSILFTGEVMSFSEYYDKFDNDRYDLGNYFETKEQAQKVIDSKEWQEFWEKVRNGEIGGDES